MLVSSTVRFHAKAHILKGEETMPKKDARPKLASVPKSRLVKLVKGDWAKIPKYLQPTIRAERDIRP